MVEAGPERRRDRLRRMGLPLGLLLGRGAVVLRIERCGLDSRRLSKRVHPEPDIPRGVLGDDRHAETVKVVLDPATLTYDEVLRCFDEIHDPTPGNRQGGDVGTRYCSAIYFVDERQEHVAREVIATLAERQRTAGCGPITTEIA